MADLRSRHPDDGCRWLCAACLDGHGSHDRFLRADRDGKCAHCGDAATTFLFYTECAACRLAPRKAVRGG